MGFGGTEIGVNVSLVVVCFKVRAGFDFSRILTPLAISNEYRDVAPVGTALGHPGELSDRTELCITWPHRKRY